MTAAAKGPPDGMARGSPGPGLVGSVLRENAGWVRALLILSLITLAFYFDRYRTERGWSAVEATGTPSARPAPEPSMEVPS